MTATVHNPVPTSEADVLRLEEELLDLDRRYEWRPEDARRRKQLDAVLKATQPKGTSRRDIFPNKGMITVAGYSDPEVKPDLPELVTRAFDKLPDEERQALIARGLVKMTPQISRASYGKLEIELF